MLLVDRHLGMAAPRSGNDVPGKMQLRLRADGRTVELPPGKTTIGSSPRCSFRIERPGVAPVHCLIVRDADQLSVRRWAADTQLNGQPFDEAPLAVGDCLALAGVELELVGPRLSNETIEASMRQADVAASACDAWLTSEQLPSGSEEYLGAGLGGIAVEIGMAATPVVEAAVAEDAAVEEEVAVVEEAVTPVAELTVAPIAEVQPEQVAEAVLAWGEGASESVSEVAEVVFRELQLACEVSRGRSRKLVAELRAARDANRELTSLLAAAREQSPSKRHESHGELETEIQGLRLEIANLENRLADHTRQMAELQMQLARTPVVAPPVFAAAVENREVESAAAPWKTPPAMPLEASADQGSSLIDSVEVEPVAEEVEAWTPLAQASPGWGARLNRASEPVETGSGVWGQAASQHGAADDFLGGENAPQVLEVEAPAWASSDIAKHSEQFGSDESPFDDVSIWKKGATESTAGFGDAEAEAPAGESESFAGWGSDAEGAAPFEDVVNQPASQVDSQAAAPNPWMAQSATANAENEARATGDAPAATPQASYIERFAHMFADEPAGEAPAEPGRPAASESLVSKPRTMGVVRNESLPDGAAASDDEESIEQYMAKLLQRVRGDAPIAVASQAAPTADVASEKNVTVNPMPQTMPQPVVPAEAEAVGAQSEEEVVEVPVNWDALTRRAAAPTTDMGALRALANESARRAISHHGLKKHRRDAVTKVIVSTLAGMTSLWLMLQAPNWRDIQFIVACVSLIMAAYWAGEAIRAMLESFRAAAYDGPGVESGATESYGGSALPIDVEVTR